MAEETEPTSPPVATTPPAGTRAAPAVSSKEPQLSTVAAARETLESLLLALILAFVFRGFVVEAFVIPTGSMATTLLGAHMQVTCQDCGLKFDATYQTANSADLRVPQAAGPVPIRTVEVDTAGNRVARTRLVDRDMSVVCPNCGYKIPTSTLDDPDNDSRNLAVHYGDRILVLKYAYLISPPQRWDVVVFKDPSDVPDYEVNFIKRLVALPNEAVLILDGDVYTAPANSNIFSIARKPERVQQALWRTIYDNDHYPVGRPRTGPDGRPAGFVSPWRPDSPAAGFKLAGPVIGFSSESTALAGLVFTPPENTPVQQLNDFLGYNQTENQGPGTPPDTSGYSYSLPTTAVSDLKLELTYKRESGDGPLELHLTKEGRRFILRVSQQQAQLLMVDERGGAAAAETPIGQAFPLPEGSLRLSLAQYDYTAIAKVNDRVIAQTTPSEFSPDVDGLIRRFAAHEASPPAGAAIFAASQTAMLSNLKLSRDIHYTSTSSRGVLRHASPLFFPERVVTLGDDEFFVLGDNSPLSADARFWLDDIDLPAEDLYAAAGRVPGRFMLGRAMVVYWPAGERPMKSMPPVLPNFREMRFIR